VPGDKLDAAIRDEVLAQGEAALFFVEALAFKLMETGILEPAEVMQALENARSTKQVEGEEGGAPRLSSCAAADLARIMNSVAALEKIRPPVKS
jgi:hypothetical protein